MNVKQIEHENLNFVLSFLHFFLAGCLLAYLTQSNVMDTKDLHAK